MATQRCLCTIVTEGQWLFLKIVFWSAVAVIACVFFMEVGFIIQDFLENRRRTRPHFGPGRSNIRQDEHRFEEIN